FTPCEQALFVWDRIGAPGRFAYLPLRTDGCQVRSVLIGTKQPTEPGLPPRRLPLRRVVGPVWHGEAHFLDSCSQRTETAPGSQLPLRQASRGALKRSRWPDHAARNACTVWE